ncbi:hypothetical protein SJA_P2-00310 (plasmid) [Sphingobium indicum UT26S]|uniref:Uncharacterized protein n=1 Tax=Sphingobium indicum (strain DSM 16413 / CCM 7287 / MTCC 6362 / UT26 / NBRC 101211 / UT26S) TaxID=452662 RepID=D4Z9C5_SPHIU|nr:hypothetical protein K426_29400 [Sphingobium sp. TKS]BAI99207.1 hypothetical protein SJA_P2-00310 [Sphingobium indicum UT26S]
MTVHALPTPTAKLHLHSPATVDRTADRTPPHRKRAAGSNRPLET